MNSAIANLINEVDDITDIYDMLSQKHKDKLVNIIVENNKKKINYLKNELVGMEKEDEDEEDEEGIVFYWDKQDEEEVEEEVKEEVVKLSFYQKNKHRILSESIFCDVCNKDVKKMNFTRHCKTKRHLKNIIQE